MKKNAFTLIEMIATIGLLGMLATITITVSVRKINETKEKARDAMIESIELAAKKYVNENEVIQFNNYDNVYITLQTLVEKEYFTESLVDPTTKKNIPLTNEIYITREENGEIKSYYNLNQRKEPKLTLIGSYNEYVEVGKDYQELGVTALNPNKQDVSSNVTITGTVDITTPNTYKITYELENVKIIRNVIVYEGNISSEQHIPKSFKKDDWNVIVKYVKKGKFPYKVGDIKTIEMDVDGNGTLEEYTIRVANTTKCSEVEVTSQTACGFVLEFADIITTYNMNPAGEYNGTQYNEGTNLGGWPASAMRKYLNSTIYNALPEELRAGIINTYVVSSHGSNTTSGNLENENAGVLESSNYWSNDKLYLLSPQEVYGTSFTNQLDSSNGTSRQLDYYEGNGVSIENYAAAIKINSSGNASWWWLRSATSNTDYRFYGSNKDGKNFNGGAYGEVGVSPTLRLTN